MRNYLVIAAILVGAGFGWWWGTYYGRYGSRSSWSRPSILTIDGSGEPKTAPIAVPGLRQFMHFDRRCIVKLEPTDQTTVEIPLDEHGKMDVSDAHLDRPHVELKGPSCGYMVSRPVVGMEMQGELK